MGPDQTYRRPWRAVPFPTDLRQPIRLLEENQKNRSTYDRIRHPAAMAIRIYLLVSAWQPTKAALRSES
jgi:hypothetical protein